MIRTRVGLFTAALLLGAGVLAGCSGSPDGSASSASPATSAAADDRSGKVAGGDLVERMVNAMRKAGTVKVATTGAGMVPSATAEVAFSGRSASTSTQASILGHPAEIVTIDNGAQVYLKSPTMNVPTWTLVEASSSIPVVKQLAGVLSSMKSSLDPTTGLKIYEKAGDFTRGGSATIDGVDTTRYTGSIPMSAIAQALGTTGEALSTANAEPLTVDIYLDKDDRPIRVVQTGTLSGQPLDSTVSYSDYGSKITVTAPKAGS